MVNKISPARDPKPTREALGLSVEEMGTYLVDKIITLESAIEQNYQAIIKTRESIFHHSYRHRLNLYGKAPINNALLVFYENNLAACRARIESLTKEYNRLEASIWVKIANWFLGFIGLPQISDPVREGRQLEKFNERAEYKKDILPLETITGLVQQHIAHTLDLTDYQAQEKENTKALRDAMQKHKKPVLKRAAHKVFKRTNEAVTATGDFFNSKKTSKKPKKTSHRWFTSKKTEPELPQTPAAPTEQKKTRSTAYSRYTKD